MGKKLSVYMIDGTEYGPRYAEIGNWVGKAFYVPRVSINSVINRAEFDNPGVYCLKSKPNSDAFTERIYIGEAEILRERIKTHLNDSNRDFEEIIFFISKDDLLTKTQIKFLESQLIKFAKEAKSAEIENSQLPSIPTLHEADRSDMDYFLEQMKLIFPLMGFNFLKQSVVISTSEPQPKVPGLTLSHITYNIKSGNLPATMYENEKGFIVEKGSQARKTTTASITDTYTRLRQNLIDRGILEDKGDYFLFTEDTIFSSPSAAANIILGRQSPGPVEWVHNGKTYKELAGY